MESTVRSTILGAGLGAGLMFLLDPTRGRSRRAVVRDRLARASRRAREGYRATTKDLGNRIAGVAAEMHGRAEDDAPDPATLVARVRAELGRVASHPRAICVMATNGFVTLTGDVLADESSAIESAVRGVRGVRSVLNQMRSHDARDRVPALQGRSVRPGWWSTWAFGSRSSTAKMLCGVSAAATFAAAVATRRAGTR